MSTYSLPVYCEVYGLEGSSTGSIAVLLPTYCEAENIESLIREIQGLNLELTIVVVDDSSPDGTSEIVKKLQKEYDNIHLISRGEKLGLGAAITAGFRYVLRLSESPDYVITMDSDYSHKPQDIPRLVNAAQRGNDLVIGSRYIQGGRMKNWPLKRKLISRVANIIAAIFIGKRMQDCTSGFRCYSRTFIGEVLSNLHSTTYEIQIETLKQAKTRRFKIKEIPITFVNRKKGKSKLSTSEVKGFLTYITKSFLAKSEAIPKLQKNNN